MTIVGEKVGIVKKVVWEGKLHEYTVEMGALTILVRDADGDGTLTIGTDEIVHSSEEVMRDLNTPKYFSKFEPLISRFRSSFPDNIVQVQRKIMSVPYAGASRHNLCRSTGSRFSRLWKWTLPEGEKAGTDREIVSASVYDHDLDGRVDEMRWTDAGGLDVKLRALKDSGPVGSNGRACDVLDRDRAGIESVLRLFDVISSHADDERDIRSIFALSALNLWQKASQKAFASSFEHAHADEIDSL